MDISHDNSKYICYGAILALRLCMWKIKRINQIDEVQQMYQLKVQGTDAERGSDMQQRPNKKIEQHLHGARFGKAISVYLPRDT